MSEEPTGMNPDDDLPPEAQKALEEFEALMKDIHDPVANGYTVVTEMYTGFRTAGMDRLDASVVVAAYLVVHDYIGKDDS
jgi:phage tail tape-measure protein